MNATVLECGHLIDGTSSEPRTDVRIVIEGDRITEVGPRSSTSIPSDAKVIDHSEEFVLPGFIDCHVHLDGTRTFSPYESISTSIAHRTVRATADIKKLIEAGFTTVRDLGSVSGLGLRDAINEGEVPGPTILTSGSIFSQTAGHGDVPSVPHDWLEKNHIRSILVDGENECRKKVRQELRKGIDVVKIMTTGGMASENTSPDHVHFTDQELEVFTEEAHRLEIPVASHAQGAPGIKAAIRSGVDTIEHGIGIDSEGIELALENDVTIVSTVSALYRLATEGEDHGLSEHHVQKGKDYFESHKASLKRAIEHDVPVAFGTDCNGSYIHPHGENAIEFELLVEEVDMEPMDALQAGTSVAAQAIGLHHEVGIIKPNSLADIVVLSSDPLKDISATRTSVESVYKRGNSINIES